MRQNKKIPPVRSSADGSACTLDALIDDAAMELLRSRGVDAQPTRRAFHDDTLLAFIGFTSDVLAGSLLVAADVTLCERLGDVNASGDDLDLALCDVAGEAANQLMGRLKNRLVRYGLTLHLSTPRAIRCTRFKLATRSGPWHRARYVSCPSGSMGIWFAATSPSEFRLVHRDDTPECALEGELMLF